MKSYPDFDPNGIADNWEDLRSREDSPLLNRATQGLYPPGSTFKVVTTLAAMERLDLTYRILKWTAKVRLISKIK